MVVQRHGSQTVMVTDSPMRGMPLDPSHAMAACHAVLKQAGLAETIHQPGEIDAIPAAGGAYVLTIRLGSALVLETTRSGKVTLEAGCYAYCGNAHGPGGLRARLARHLRSEKRPHWHVDRLTVHAARLAALPVPGGDECELVARLTRRKEFAIALAGFGSTDCRNCESHLLRFCG